MEESVNNPIVRRIQTPEAMADFGADLAHLLRAGDLLVLIGPLGAGKTTLTRGIGEGLGVRGPVTSPTFVLARTHPSLAGGPGLVHVDAYRLGSALEIDDLDIDFANSIVVVEWGAGMLDGIASSWLELRIDRPMGAKTRVGDGADAADAADGAAFDPAIDPVEARTVTVSAFGPRWAGVFSGAGSGSAGRLSDNG